MKRKRLPEQGVELNNSTQLDATSSQNDYYMCVCGSKFKSRPSIIRHVKVCEINSNLTCKWCNLKFKNRGNLINHAYYMHGSQKPTPLNKNQIVKCEVCDAEFRQKWQLKFHIRRNHFNLLATIPHAHNKQVNQIWFEKVLNTDLVMEIKKTGASSLIMKPIPLNANVKIHNNNKKIDLTEQYPTGKKKIDDTCRICLKIFRKQDLKKHMNEKHYNVTKHVCNNCNVSFKRSYQFLQHVCFKTRKRQLVRGVRQPVNSSIKISRVESCPVVIS